jgi:hypothetical protein
MVVLSYDPEREPLDPKPPRVTPMARLLVNDGLVAGSEVREERYKGP